MLVLAFVVVPLVELVLLVLLQDRIGLGTTIGIVIATGVVGAWLVRRQGLRTWQAAREQLTVGSLPNRELAHGAMILFGGALLLTPGFLTDAVGFSMMVPPVRELVRRTVSKRMANRVVVIDP